MPETQLNQRALDLLRRLQLCCELNLQEMEPMTRDLCVEMDDLLKELEVSNV